MKKKEKYPKRRMDAVSGVYAGPSFMNRPVRKFGKQENSDADIDADIVEVYGGPEMMESWRRGEPEEPQVEDTQAEEPQVEDTQAEELQVEDKQAEELQEEDAQAEESQPERPGRDNKIPALKKFRKARFPDNEFDPRIAMAVYGGPDYFSPNSASAPVFGIPFKAVSNEETASKTAAVDPNAKHCKECGSILMPNARFCTECGTPVPKDEGETI
ncbi:MAG: zinc ribbon domain-containing protein [Clostridia bacterium]|nr:zinc ribbon domain-containing protein [Clostridia bacterium]